jgi:hypothetical protein
LYGFELSAAEMHEIDRLGEGKKENCAPDNTEAA